MYSISKINSLDLLEICHLLIEELLPIEDKPRGIYILGSSLEQLLTTEHSYKITNSTNKIVGFISYSSKDNITLLDYYFVHPDYRKSAPMLIIAKLLQEPLSTSEKVYFFEYSDSMSLPIDICKDTLIDLVQFNRHLKIIEKRWGNVYDRVIDER